MAVSSAPASAATRLRSLSAGLLLSRLAGLGILGSVALAVYLFPLSPLWIGSGLLAYVVLLARRPHAWLVVLPAVLPVLDLTPWSGRIYLGTFDFLVLSTIGVGLWQGSFAARIPISRRGRLIIAAFFLVQLVSMLRGLLPLEAIDANSFIGYYSHYNSLRVAKGMLWALLLLPLLGAAREQGRPVGRLLAIGMVVGIGLAGLSIAWERLLFTGLFDFKSSYRVTGMFSAMHTGGTAIDAYLACGFPFVAACFVLWRRWTTNLLGIALFALALYAFLVTYSRTDYLAAAVIIVALGMGDMLTRNPQPERGLLLTGVALLFTLLAGLIAVPILSGGYITARFEHVPTDLRTRLHHWRHTLAIRDDGWATALFGMGTGSFPRVYRARTGDRPLSPTFTLAGEGKGQYLRLNPSGAQGTLYIRHRFRATEPGPYRLDLRLRGWSEKPEKLLIEFCAANVLRVPQYCHWTGVHIAKASAGQWHEYHKSVDVGRFNDGRLSRLRPLEIVLLDRGLRTPVDVGSVQLVTPSGKPLLANGDFAAGFDHWFWSSGDHLAMHAENLLVELLFDSGWFGVLTFLTLGAYILGRLLSRIARGERLAVILLAAVVGLFTIGAFGSVFDNPRITLLFLLIGWTSVFPVDPPVAGTGRRIVPWGRLVGVLLLGGTVAGAGVFVHLMRAHDLSARQLLVVGLQRSGAQWPWLAKAVAPPERYAQRPLDGHLRPQHPRVLLPGLAQWDGVGVPKLIQEREALFKEQGIRVPSACVDYDILAEIACWVSTGNPKAARKLEASVRAFRVSAPHESGSYGNVWQLALAYDFLRRDPGFTAADRAQARAKIRHGLKETLALLDEVGASLWHGRTTLSDIAWISAVVLDPTDAATRSLQRRAQGYYLDSMAALGMTELWPSGYNYWINSRGLLVGLAASAYLNGLEGAANAPQIKHILRRVGQWTIAATRPDNRIQGYGDEGPRIDLKDETRRVIDLFAQATRDPVLATYSRYLGHVWPHESYYSHYRPEFILFNDPSVPALPATSLATVGQNLPKAELFGRDATNAAYIRSGWGPDATFVSFMASDVFSHHQHYAAGEFTLFKGAPLAVNSATYRGNITTPNRLDYAIRSIAANTLLILRPGETVHPNHFFANNVAAGGQRVVMPTGSAISSVQDWMNNLNRGLHLEAAHLSGFEYRPGDYAYVSADLTPAYDNPQYDVGGHGGKVEHVSRDLVYLYGEDRVIVHDAVRSTHAGYVKKWLLHTETRPEIADLHPLKGTLDDGISQSRADTAIVRNGRGTLLVRRLYPKDAVMRLVGGKDYQYYVESDGDDSTLDGRNISQGARDRPWFDVGHWRIEIQPGEPRRFDQFLVVLSPGLDHVRSDGGTALDVLTDNVEGVVTPHSVTAFLRPGGELKARFVLPAGRQVLRVVHVPLLANPELRYTGGSLQGRLSANGIAEFDIADLPAGEVTLSWR